MSKQIFIRIGQKIREIRTQRNIRLHELAEESQISKGLLSRVENGRATPSLPVLLSIVGALKVKLDVFFEGMELLEEKSYIHRKKTEYTSFQKEEGIGFLYHFVLNSTLPNMNLEAVILDLQPGSQREHVTTDGFEFKYLLKGTIDYHLGNEVISLEEGDSLFFNGKIPHVPVNRSDQPASLLVLYLLVAPNDAA